MGGVSDFSGFHRQRGIKLGEQTLGSRQGGISLESRNGCFWGRRSGWYSGLCHLRGRKLWSWLLWFLVGPSAATAPHIRQACCQCDDRFPCADTIRDAKDQCTSDPAPDQAGCFRIRLFTKGTTGKG